MLSMISSKKLSLKNASIIFACFAFIFSNAQNKNSKQSTLGSTVTLGGVQYTLKAHPRVFLDGPGGVLTTAQSDGSSMGRANLNNPPYEALKYMTDYFIANNSTNPLANYFSGDPMTSYADCAIRWLADGDANSLTMAKFGINHAEYVIGGSAGCDITQGYCGGRDDDSDYARFNLIHLMQTYSIIRDQLTPTERKTFANKILNDNDLTHNGIDTVQCSNQSIADGVGTLSGTGKTITISGGNTSQFTVGSILFDVANSQMAIVESITDVSTFIINQDVVWSGKSFHFSPPWTDGNCGVLWFVKHHNAAPPLTPGQEANYTSDYPTGNVFTYPAGNLTYTALVGYIAIGVALADEDTRAARLLEQAYNYYIENQYVYSRISWTPFTQGGASYGQGRLHFSSTLIALMLKNSFDNGPDLTQGVYIKRQLPYWYYNYIPNWPWGLSFEDIYYPVYEQAPLRSLFATTWLYKNTKEADYANYFFRNIRNDFVAGELDNNSGSYLLYSYMFTDPAQTKSNLTSAPTQYLFKDTDYGLCASLGLNCDQSKVNVFGADLSKVAYGKVITRTGWGANDNVILLQASYNDGTDHSGAGNWGSMHIYRNDYLLAGDRPAGNGNLANDNLIELNSGNNSWINGNHPGYATIDRWAGVNPTGDSLSRYSYALLNLTEVYNSSEGANLVNREVVHLKKTGGQDYLINYDDVITNSPGSKKAYYHYSLNGLTSPVSYDAVTRRVINTQANSMLITQFLPVNGNNSIALTKENADGSYTGGEGNTYRVTLSPSVDGTSATATSTTFESISIHLAVSNTSSVMPNLTQPVCTSIGGNATAVEIHDNIPKVAIFARQGVLLNQISLTTTHVGIAQYLATGLEPGTYNVTVNGNPVLTGTVIKSDDNSLYFETASGNIVITQTNTSVKDLKNNDYVKIHPNPANNLLLIDNTPNRISIINIGIFTLQGEKIFEKTENIQLHTEIDVSTLSAGIYIIKLKDSLGEQFVKKIAITK